MCHWDEQVRQGVAWSSKGDSGFANMDIPVAHQLVHFPEDGCAQTRAFVLLGFSGESLDSFWIDEAGIEVWSLSHTCVAPHLSLKVVSR